MTVVRNATDVNTLADAVDGVDKEAVRGFLDELGLEGRHLVTFLGSLEPTKRLEWLFEACDAARASLPDLELLLVGDGRERAQVEAQVASRPWARWLPPPLRRGPGAGARRVAPAAGPPTGSAS